MNDEELLEVNIEEELEDLSHARNWSEGATLWSTDWTAETVMTQLRRGNIDLEPSFQRRSAWTEKRQSLFIESLILGLPIPQLILAEDKTRKGAFIVIDGKQRLLAIRKFGADPTNDKDKGFDPLLLDGLKARPDLHRMTYSTMKNDLLFSNELAAFENSSVRTVVIRNWQNESYLYEVFLRINTGSVQLSPQELRQALHPGPFSKFVNDRSAESVELQKALGLSKPDFRMRDAELLLRYLSYSNFSDIYNGNLKDFLDISTEKLNTSWSANEASLSDAVYAMEEAFKATHRIFGERDYLRKWNGQEFEKRKNRAVIDIMLYFFSNSEIRKAAILHADRVKSEFIRLCESDTQFLGAIERTTKSKESNKFRFNRWAQVLRGITQLPIPDVSFGA